MWRDESGVTAVEFAIVAPILLLLLFGILEFSGIMLVSVLMEGATNMSSRLGATGYSSGGESRTQTILDAVKQNAGVLIDANNVTVTAESYGQFNQIGQPEPYTDTNHNGQYDAGEPYTDINGNGQWDADMGAAGYGGAGDVVVYTVSYPWHIMTPMMGRLIGTGGIYTITAHAVVKNEPYND
ncbi:MAG: TadE/TadG family type IV pilus assembly protein [Alphaproteobacteria bacterium]